MLGWLVFEEVYWGRDDDLNLMIFLGGFEGIIFYFELNCKSVTAPGGYCYVEMFGFILLAMGFRIYYVFEINVITL